MAFRTIIAILVLLSPYTAQAKDNRPLDPEMATGMAQVQTARGTKMMAVTASPQATEAAYDILKKGGTAADAAIAAQMVLGLVEPQSSGLGGGAFVLYYDAKSKKLLTYDGRETAPAVAGAQLFTDEQGKALEFYKAANGGRAVGTPGIMRLMGTLHEAQGNTPWADLFKPAIRLAEDGFVVSKRLSLMAGKEAGRFDVDTEAQIYFLPDTTHPIEAGALKTNENYATTLNYLAAQGADSFYDGPLARNLVQKVRENRFNPGLLAVEDLKDYRVKVRNPVCGGYRGYKVCSMGQPSSGGLTLLEILGMLQQFDLRAMGVNSPQSWHVISEASRLAFSDRNQFMADSDFVATPDILLLNAAYLEERAKLIDPTKAQLKVVYGNPAGWQGTLTGGDGSLKPPGTTHLSIVDSYGNILSMTSSIENAFGSRVMVDGYLLNNQLTDFAFEPNDEAGNPKANRVQAGKRPRSSMSPTIIFDPQGNPFMVVGSAGGSRIIGFVLQQIINVIDWQMTVEESLKTPHILHRGEKLEVEFSGMERADGLKNFGHPVLVTEMNSGITLIEFNNGEMIGAADPRRDGTAAGE